MPEAPSPSTAPATATTSAASSSSRSRAQYFENISPVNGKPFTEVGRGTVEDIDRAVDVAWKAFESWKRTTPAERANILNKIADRIEQNLEAIAVAETWENGKPVRETLAADIPLVVDHFRYFAGVLRAQEGSLSQIDEDTVAYHFNEPLGVVGQIIPWNFPILMATWKLAPALAAGNCVVLKPAEQTPARILFLFEIIGDLLPAGVVNIVNGFGIEAGAPLAQHKRIRKIAFTGETTTGRLIMQYASQNLIPVTLELGGKSANIFFEDVARSDDAYYDKALEGFTFFALNQRRGLHLPVAGTHPALDLRPVPRRRPRARRQDRAGQPARPGDDDRRAGLERPAREDPQLHRHRQGGWREAAHRRRARRPRRRPERGLLRAARPSSRARTTCASSRRRSSDRSSRSRRSTTSTTRSTSPTTRSTASAPVCGAASGDTAYRAGRAIEAGRVWTNTYHQYPAHAAFGGYKQSGIGRENHLKMLDHYQQTKNLLVSYAEGAMGFF